MGEAVSDQFCRSFPSWGSRVCDDGGDISRQQQGARRVRILQEESSCLLEKLDIQMPVCVRCMMPSIYLICDLVYFVNGAVPGYVNGI